MVNECNPEKVGQEQQGGQEEGWGGGYGKEKEE